MSFVPILKKINSRLISRLTHTHTYTHLLYDLVTSSQKEKLLLPLKKKRNSTCGQILPFVTCE